MLKSSNYGRFIWRLSVFIIPLFLVFSWFRFGKLIAFAEEGILFYQPMLILEKYKYLWVDAGFGYSNPFYYPRLPLFYLADLFQKIGFAPWITQALVFYILLLTPLVFTLKLIKALGIKKPSVGYIAAFFYLFNLFTISQVWGRFIMPLIFLWSYFPLFLFLWIKLLKNKNHIHLFYLILSSFLYSYSFGIPSSLLVIYIPVFIYELTQLYKSKNKLDTFSRFFIYLSIWLIFNLWWFYPSIIISNSNLSGYLEGGSSAESLKAVSQYYPINEIVFLKQLYLFSDNLNFNSFYSTASSLLISVLILAVTIMGLIYALRKHKQYMFLILLTLISLFLVKGANPPFGEGFYNILFKYIPPSQVLRNPYEKGGILFVFVYSILFAIGLKKVSGIFTKKHLIIPFIFIVVFGWYMQPLWKGFIFPAYSHVNVPTYYQEANVYLSTLGDNRVLQMPLTISDGVKYDWGYRGIQHLDQLFDRPVIGNPGGSIAAAEFYYLMRGQNFMRNQYFTNIFPILNIKHVVINEDLEITSPHDIKVSQSYDFVENWNNVVRLTEFDALKIYGYKGASDQRIYLVPELVGAETLQGAFEVFFEPDYDAYKKGVIVKGVGKNEIVVDNFQTIPKYTVTKHSPENYSVQVNNANNPYYLVLTDSFDVLWKLSKDSEEIGEHFMINGISNAWYLDERGDYTIDVVFKVWPWD